MPSLRDLQRDFVEALYTDVRADKAWVVSNGVLVHDRIGIYRHNLRQGFRNALALTYPVIERLVGTAYFDRLAREYQDAYPSRAGDLHYASEHFSAFLAQRFADSEYAYFADVARLEWAIEDARRAAGAAFLEASELAAVDAERYGEMRLRLHSAARLVCSPYPVHRIWRANQPDADGSGVTLDAGAERLLVRAIEDDVYLVSLCEAEAAFIAAIVAGAALGVAVDAALRVDAEFDLARMLARLFALRAFARCAAESLVIR